ncbi:PadR family transcriptional regulator [Brevundimonas naejangsanensis]|uniref:PadR family transcriptional regulator n=1 Tax=Brevundimonas naejangsanensis TaxID=588932 RepID=UPI00119DEBBE|nr:helix-turn-helix transcriptional regulator [Brevundimonas naejangsanensis]
MTRERNPLDGLRQELRRGTLVLAVLSALRHERCGADLIAILAGANVPIEPGALYPMLRRLEDQGLLVSEWRVEDARRRRFYRASTEGGKTADELTTDLARLTAGLQSLKEDGE